MENVSPVAETGLNFEKVDVQILKLEKAGEFFIGKYVEMTKRPWLDKTTGEEKEITQLHFTDLQGKSPFIVFADAGLLNAFTTANIKAGDVIKGVKGEKMKLDGAKSVNTWEIYKANTAH